MHKRPYEKLIVWQESHALTLLIHRLTTTFPAYERYALADQMRRSSSSVPTNITEGNARKTHKEKLRYFEIALASLEELHYQCRLSHDLQYMTTETFHDIDKHIQRISFLLTKLRHFFK